jgi:DNA-binding transcriptional LysR family regulator
MRGRGFAELSAFIAVADFGSFTKAAAQLRLSTSSLSQTVRALEERLGVRLLNRTTRSVAPTEAGEKMLERLRPLFEELEAAVDEVNAFRDNHVSQSRHLSLPLCSPRYYQNFSHNTRKSLLMYRWIQC